MEAWVEREIEGCRFPDERLKKRFGKLLGQLGKTIGATLPAACQDWAATKAAYRFFNNPRVDESVILAGHFAATKSRMAAAKGPLLMLHDTTEFSFQRDRPRLLVRLACYQVFALAPSRSLSVDCSCTPAWQSLRPVNRWD